jgi:hypothetical protein
MDFSIKSPIVRPLPSSPDAFSPQVPKQRGYKVESVPLNDAVKGAVSAGAPYARPNLRVPKQVKPATTALLDGNFDYLRPMLKQCVEKTEKALNMHLHALGHLSASDMVERLTSPKMRGIMIQYHVLCTSMDIASTPPNEHLLGTLALGMLVLDEDRANKFVNFLLPLIRAGDTPEVITEILVLAMPVTLSQHPSFIDVLAQFHEWADNASTWCNFIKLGRHLWLQSPERCTQSLANLTMLIGAHKSGLSDDETGQIIDHFGQANHTPAGSEALFGLVDQLCRQHIRRGGDSLKGPSFGESVARVAQYTSADLQCLEAMWWRCKATGHKGIQFRTVISSLMHVELPKRQPLCDHVLYFADSSMTNQQIKKLFELFAEHDTASFIDQAMPLRDKFRGSKRITHLITLTKMPTQERAAYVGRVTQGTDTAVTMMHSG